MYGVQCDRHAINMRYVSLLIYNTAQFTAVLLQKFESAIAMIFILRLKCVYTSVYTTRRIRYNPMYFIHFPVPSRYRANLINLLKFTLNLSMHSLKTFHAVQN